MQIYAMTHQVFDVNCPKNREFQNSFKEKVKKFYFMNCKLFENR